MPGVPSGKGCDACVKQKKKCDQSKPACSRCARLQIPCTGSGQQRYKFKQVRAGPPGQSGGKRSPQSSAASSVRSLSRTPSNETTSTLNGFVHKLEVQDIRFDLVWAYGGLLREIPKRLGTNSALDAAVMAMTSTATDLAAGYKSPEALVRYGTALTALRTCLDDPVTAQSSSTLCAIYLIWICQSWIGMSPDMNCGHGSGIVQILATAPYRNSQDPFEQMLLMTIAGPVVFESIFNPEVQLNPWVKDWVMEMEKPLVEPGEESTQNNGKPQVGRIMSCLVRLPEFMRYRPENLYEIQQNYAAVQGTSKMIYEKFVEAASAMKNPSADLSSLQISRVMVKILPMRLHAFYQRTYAILLAVEILLNGILRAYTPEDHILEEENQRLTRTIIDLSLEGSIWKPIGAGWVPVCLISAWGATMDPARKKQIEKVWDESWKEITPMSLNVAASTIGDTFDQLRLAAFRGSSFSPYDLDSPFELPPEILSV